MKDKDSVLLEIMYESIYLDSYELSLMLEMADRTTAVNTIAKRSNVPKDVAEYLVDKSDKYALWIANQLNKKPEFKNTPPENKLKWIQDNVEEQLTEILANLAEGSKVKNFNPFTLSWDDALAGNFERAHKKVGGDSAQFIDYLKEKFPDTYQYFIKQIKESKAFKNTFDEIPDKINWFKSKFEFQQKDVEEFLKREMGRQYFWAAKTIKEMPEFQSAVNKLPFVRSLERVTIGDQTWTDAFHNISEWLNAPDAFSNIGDRLGKGVTNPYDIKPLESRRDIGTGEPRPAESPWQRAAKVADRYMVENSPGVGYLELPIPGQLPESYKNTPEYIRDVKEGGYGTRESYMKGSEFPVGKVIKTYPNGFFWVDSEVNAKKINDRRSHDAFLLGHCGSDTGIHDPETREDAYKGSSLFSLRKVVDVPLKKADKSPVLDKDGNPVYEKKIKGYVSFTANPSKHLWYQLKCKENTSVYNNENKWIIPYIADIMVQLDLYKQGYPDFKLTDLVDVVKQRASKIQGSEDFLKNVEKLYKRRLLKDKVESLATNFNAKKFDDSDDDIKEAYIEFGYEIPDVNCIKKLNDNLKKLYKQKLAEDPEKAKNYLILKVNDGDGFNDFDPNILKSVTNSASATTDLVLKFLQKNNDNFDGIPKSVMTGLGSVTNNNRNSKSDDLTVRYFKYLLIHKKEDILDIDPNIFKAISSTGPDNFKIAMDAVFQSGQADRISELQDRPNWSEEMKTDPRADIIDWLECHRMNY